MPRDLVERSFPEGLFIPLERPRTRTAREAGMDDRHVNRRPHDERRRNQHPAIPDHGVSRDLDPRHPVGLSPSDLMGLQSTAGNQAVKRLLAHQRAGGATSRPARSTSATAALIQRDTLTDIRAESEDFWTEVTTRVMVRYGQWINDTRQALNQFVTDMGRRRARTRAVTGGA
jgi:hypothetical protein